MQKVLLLSTLLLLGLFGSQLLPGAIGPAYAGIGDVIRILTMAGLSFIMIRVGCEFDINKSNLKHYGWDYVVAFTAASLPWVFVTLYFVFILLPPINWGTVASWQETLLAGRFASPTSAGVLFSMLAAAGLGTTWLFRKVRILAIFDDLDTVLLMVPLKMLMVGLAVAIGMWPRGEVGAGVLVISMSYGIGGPILTIAILSLALNLMLTGVFIYIVKRLTGPLPAYGQQITRESPAVGKRALRSVNIETGLFL